jgi:hypothetical protein
MNNNKKYVFDTLDVSKGNKQGVTGFKLNYYLGYSVFKHRANLRHGRNVEKIYIPKWKFTGVSVWLYWIKL